MDRMKKTWLRIVATRQAASAAMEPAPFQKKEVPEALALYREQKLAQNELSRAASEILKEHGFKADGHKRKRRG